MICPFKCGGVPLIAAGIGWFLSAVVIRIIAAYWFHILNLLAVLSPKFLRYIALWLDMEGIYVSDVQDCQLFFSFHFIILPDNCMCFGSRFASSNCVIDSGGFSRAYNTYWKWYEWNHVRTLYFMYCIYVRRFNFRNTIEMRTKYKIVSTSQRVARVLHRTHASTYCLISSLGERKGEAKECFRVAWLGKWVLGLL